MVKNKDPTFLHIQFLDCILLPEKDVFQSFEFHVELLSVIIWRGSEVVIVQIPNELLVLDQVLVLEKDQPSHQLDIARRLHMLQRIFFIVRVIILLPVPFI